MGLYSHYDSSHTHPVNRALHMIAIPLGFSSIFFLRRHPKLALTLIPTAFGIAWVGHLIEGNKPAFLRDPRQVLMAPAWMARRIFARGETEERARAMARSA